MSHEYRESPPTAPVRSEEERYRAVFEAAPDGILIVDSEGIIRDANPAAVELFGYEADEMLGRPVEILVPEGVRSGHRRQREEYTEDPRVRPMGIDMELRGLRSDGAVFPVEISLSPLPTDDGLQVIAAIRDMSERRRLREFGAGAMRAAEEERQRIARELHDDTAQRLAAVLLRLELAQRARAELDRSQILEEVHDEILECAEGVRRIARGLRPPALEDAGVATAIRGHVRGVRESSGMETEMRIDPAVDQMLDLNAKLVLYRIVQEALSNAVRHSGAHRVDVRIETASEAITVEVEDDGRGFDVEEALGGTGGGLGLLGMRERAALVGGRMQIESARGRGTRIRVDIPASEG